MSITNTDARNAIIGAVNTVWADNSTAIFGGSRELRFPSVEYRDAPAKDEAWGYCEMFVTNSRQTGLRNDDTRRYETVGVLTVDVHAPRSEANSETIALAMGNTIKRVLEKPSAGEVWYRNVTAGTSRQTAGSVVVRVVADFKYTEEGASDG